jgi:hypothetical protein
MTLEDSASLTSSKNARHTFRLSDKQKQTSKMNKNSSRVLCGGETLLQDEIELEVFILKNVGGETFSVVSERSREFSSVSGSFKSLSLPSPRAIVSPTTNHLP